LNPEGVTYRSVSEAQVSQSSQKVKSVINECVPLITGYRALMMSGYPVGQALTWALAWVVSVLGP